MLRISDTRIQLLDRVRRLRRVRNSRQGWNDLTRGLSHFAGRIVSVLDAAAEGIGDKAPAALFIWITLLCGKPIGSEHQQSGAKEKVDSASHDGSCGSNGLNSPTGRLTLLEFSGEDLNAELTQVEQ
jgi:hypothetical protein